MYALLWHHTIGPGCCNSVGIGSILQLMQAAKPYSIAEVLRILCLPMTDPNSPFAGDPEKVHADRRQQLANLKEAGAIENSTTSLTVVDTEHGRTVTEVIRIRA